LNLKPKKRLVTLFILLAAILVIAILLTGCVRGMSPIGWAGVAIANDALYTGSKEGRVVSIALSNLAMRSSPAITVTTSGTFGCGGSTNPVAIYGTPALANGLVFIAAYNGEVDAYTADTLEYRWSFPQKGVSNLKPIIGAIEVSGDTLYFGGTDGNVYGLDAVTGNKKWQFTTGGEIWSTPAIANNTLYIGSFDKKIYAVDIPTQTKKWEFTTGATNIAPPLVFEGLVYAGSLDRSIYAINQNDGSQAWKFTGGNWFWAKPVVYNGVIFAPNLDNHVYGLDAKTGQKVFDYNVEGQVASWPVVVGNRVIVATEDGKIYSLGTDRNSPNQRPLDPLPENVVVTSPLSALNDIVYINGSDNQIYQVNLTTGQNSVLKSLNVQ
jgi:eukaryotic-like serine/threonine-protein kinase